MLKKHLFVISLLMFTAHILSAQKAVDAKPKELKKVMELKMPDSTGTNGAQVAWHPIQKKYYAAFAGNKTYPIAVFDIKGKLLSPKGLKTQFDVRGLWYNPIEKNIQTNGYDTLGWASYTLDAKGIPTGVKTIFTGAHQPGFQSVGAYNIKENVLHFFNDDGNVDVYNTKTGKYETEITLYLHYTEDDSDIAYLEDNYDEIDNYNSTTLVYTGIPKAEIALLNYNNKAIELYNIKTGFLTSEINLPEDAMTSAVLNFAYANNIYWLFDKENRKWVGYR